MDDPDVDVAELDRALGDLRAVNRWLGGTRVVIHHLGHLLARLPRTTFRILDVATGSADIPLQLVKWARARGIRLEIVATDVHPQTTALARTHTRGISEIQVEEADVLNLPFAPHSFDVTLCSTALHHFSRDDAVRALGELDRVARHAVIVSDLRRSRPALLGAQLLAVTVWRRSRLTRHDGPLSVCQAFTPAELLELACAASLRNVRVFTHPVFRVALVVDRTGTS